MKRLLLDKLLEWKQFKDRKPLILQGARQVGKTWILKEFSKQHYSNCFYFNFEENPGLVELFSKSLKTDFLIEQLSFFYGSNISVSDSLIIFDEIQVSPKALTSLKYFYDERPDLHIAAAGSLLGVSFGKSSSFPVGKVNFMTLYSMSLVEFLLAEDKKLLVDYLQKNDTQKSIASSVHEQLLNLYKKYLYVGGMPAVVKSWIADRDPKQVRFLQSEIIKAYEKDFSKYTAPADAIKISEVWKTIPAVLSKENKKFQYRNITPSARASSYRTAIEWLDKAGLIHLSYNIKTPKLPLSGYSDYSKFKIYFHDTGLLGCMLNLESRSIVNREALFSEYNGAFTENFTACELLRSGEDRLYYWSSKSDAEIDFIININGVVPIEVKSGYSRHKKSLSAYGEKYNPNFLIRLSPREYVESGDFINIPLYEAAFIRGRIR